MNRCCFNLPIQIRDNVFPIPNVILFENWHFRVINNVFIFTFMCSTLVSVLGSGHKYIKYGYNLFDTVLMATFN